MKLNKTPQSENEPQTFKGYSAVATLYADRVEIRRNRFAKLAGHKDSTTYFADILKPHGKPPTRLLRRHLIW
ncbi:hypothetical protein ABZ484_28755 [Streptomyces sp. NPDC006393]|uniref:hypothetical protein n=1 Tax=Streptomyces sp. NPDC006393 TaxID=3156763 RepID=UPI00340430C3